MQSKGQLKTSNNISIRFSEVDSMNIVWHMLVANSVSFYEPDFLDKKLSRTKKCLKNSFILQNLF